VVKGDTITVTSTITCTDSLAGSVELLELFIRPFEDSRASKRNLFRIKVNKDGSNLKIPHFEDSNSARNSGIGELTSLRETLPAQLSSPSSLRKGDTYVTSADIKCLEASAADLPTLISSTAVLKAADKVKSSMGDISVDWRYADSKFLVPLDLTSYLDSASLSIDASANQRLSNDVNVFSWLPLIDRKGMSGNESPIHEEIAISRICSMIFSIPQVQVVESPFDVIVSSPSMATLGEICEIAFTVKNKLWNVERVVVSVDISDAYLITGGTQMVYEVSF